MNKTGSVLCSLHQSGRGRKWRFYVDRKLLGRIVIAYIASQTLCISADAPASMTRVQLRRS